MYLRLNSQQPSYHYMKLIKKEVSLAAIIHLYFTTVSKTLSLKAVKEGQTFIFGTLFGTSKLFLILLFMSLACHCFIKRLVLFRVCQDDPGSVCVGISPLSSSWVSWARPLPVGSAGSPWVSSQVSSQGQESQGVCNKEYRRVGGLQHRVQES